MAIITQTLPWVLHPSSLLLEGGNPQNPPHLSDSAHRTAKAIIVQLSMVVDIRTPTS
jgi:hypothetical protein